jgi:hypothetical protein
VGCVCDAWRLCIRCLKGNPDMGRNCIVKIEFFAFVEIIIILQRWLTEICCVSYQRIVECIAMLERTATLGEYGHLVNILLKDHQNWVWAKFYPRSPVRHLRHRSTEVVPLFSPLACEPKS